MQPTDDAPRAPHVVVLAPDSAREGSHERDVAMALDTAGYRVTLLAVAEGDREQAWLGRVCLLRVAVPGGRRAPTEVPPGRRSRVGYATEEARLAAESRVRLAKILAAGRWPALVVHSASALRGAGVRGRIGAGRVVDGIGRRSRRAPVSVWLPLARARRRDIPELDELDLAFGAELDALMTDFVHTSDVRVTVAARRAVGRARLRRRRPLWVHEAVTPRAAGVHGTAVSRALDRRAALQRALVRDADRVVSGTGTAVLAAYRELLGDRPLSPVASAPAAPVMETAAPTEDRPADLPTLVGVGPANMAGQAWAWAKALEQERGVGTQVLMVDRGSALLFPADELVPTATYGRDRAWQERTRDRILGTWTHAVLEAGRPLMGTLHGRSFAGDAEVMSQAGIGVALVFHGSELRDPRRHAESSPWSPFRDPTDEWANRVQATVDLLRPQIDAYDGPCLVSTPDLLEDLPRATWLPVVVDCGLWVPGPPVLEREVPVVVHAPSRAAIKGTSFVDDAVAPLVEAGRVEYRRIEGLPPEQMPAALADADIVLDQFAIGSYGVLACQAMASGRLVVGHVTERVRAHVERETDHRLPVVQATPDELHDVLTRIIGDREAERGTAARGPSFARAVHGGNRSAHVLADVLGLGEGRTGS